MKNIHIEVIYNFFSYLIFIKYPTNVNNANNDISNDSEFS